MTTQSFTRFVHTVEGQNQVALGHALAKESSEGNISRMLPIKDPIVIRNKENVGNYNPNIENKTLSLICRYIQCLPMKGNCSTTVSPLGHCCEICGAVLTFASNRFNLNTISDVVREVLDDKNLKGLIQYSIERFDAEEGNEIIPRYQIAGFPLSTYDDRVFAIFTLEVHYKLTSLRANMMEYFNAEYKWSKLDHSYAQASKIAGLITFCILILIVVALSLRTTTDANRNTSLFQVLWRQGKEDDDVVQLINPVEEEEERTTFLPMEVSKPAMLQVDKYSVAASNPTEGLPAVEMQLIK